MDITGLHKVFVNKQEEFVILRFIFSELYPKMHFIDFDKLVQNKLNSTADCTMFKLENDNGNIAGYIYTIDFKTKEYFLRKIFNNNSYISAVNDLEKEELVLKNNASLSMFKNKIQN